MSHGSAEQMIPKLLAEVDIKINGSNPWDIQIHNPALFDRILTSGSLGLGEAYMDGWWECAQLDEFFYRIIRADLGRRIRKDINIKIIFSALLNGVFMGHRARAFRVGEQHYDTGNDIFQAMLDKRLVYTCGYWKNVNNLDDAQEAKLELVCQKIRLKPGMRVLDIGGGWGSFAKYAAQKHGVSVVNVTVSKEQVALANELCRGLPVENRLQDYRDVNEKFDAIVSLGMFEHVGQRYYGTYTNVVRRCLSEDGLFLLHTIGKNDSSAGSEPWIAKYIFPNSILPSAKWIAEAMENKFVIEDWHNFGPDYDKTLMAWHKNFRDRWPELSVKYSERFRRMWRYYLLSCAGAFRARSIQLWQIVLSKHGVPGGYRSIR